MSSDPAVGCSGPFDAAIQRTLLEHLHALAPGDFPGVDGMTASDALHCYKTLASRHRVPGREELLRKHPEWAERLDALLSVTDC